MQPLPFPSEQVTAIFLILFSFVILIHSLLPGSPVILTHFGGVLSCTVLPDSSDASSDVLLFSL